MLGVRQALPLPEIESPTSRSLAHLRKLGYTAEVVEKWNQYARIKQDFAGFADIIAFGNGEIVAVQTTTNANLSARQKKILNEPKAHLWVKAGGIISLHGWSKKGPRGEKKTWTITERVLVP